MNGWQISFGIFYAGNLIMSIVAILQGNWDQASTHVGFAILMHLLTEKEDKS